VTSPEAAPTANVACDLVRTPTTYVTSTVATSTPATPLHLRMYFAICTRRCGRLASLGRFPLFFSLTRRHLPALDSVWFTAEEEARVVGVPGIWALMDQLCWSVGPQPGPLDAND
jgi:hypothetical protein